MNEVKFKATYMMMIIIIINSYGLGLVACSTSELFLKLWIKLDIW
jgi:hypothetical protein